MSTRDNISNQQQKKESFGKQIKSSMLVGIIVAVGIQAIVIATGGFIRIDITIANLLGMFVFCSAGLFAYSVLKNIVKNKWLNKKNN